MVNLPLGSRFYRESDSITPKKEDEEADERNCQPKDQVTIKVIKEVANSIMSFLDFTEEASQGPEHPVECLDTHIWICTHRNRKTGARED